MQKHVLATQVKLLILHSGKNTNLILHDIHQENFTLRYFYILCNISKYNLGA